MPELTWYGKYDKDGKRNAPLRIALPFQTVETVNESAQQRQISMERFLGGREPEWRNRLIWGDKKYVLPSLLAEFAGKVDLIYIDPPFHTGADFSYRVRIDGEDFTKEPSIIEQKAYRDTWGVSPAERRAGATQMDKYLKWFYEAVVLLRELLAPAGSIYVHMDWHVGHYAKVLMDEVFGNENFKNEIVWYYWNKFQMRDMGAFTRNHQSLFWYVKSLERYTYYPQTQPIDRPKKLKRIYWDKEKGRIQNVKDQDGRVIYDEYRDEKVDDVWDIPYLGTRANERLGFDTQKPEALLARVIKASSNEGDLVLDCFAGSGTTAAAAEKLGRRWIACDMSRFAIHTTRKRLLSIPDVRPFIVQNLGKYERQAWQVAEFGERAEATMQNYRRFILEIYHAQPLAGHTYLHGVKGGRMVYVGAVDSPVSPGDVTRIVSEFRRLVGTGKDAPGTNGVDILGWDFAFELNEVAKQQAASAKIDLRFLRIPREVMERRAVEQGDIRFFELAALAIGVEQKGRTVTLELTDFMIPPDDVPEDVRRAITHWEQWIDYWAVDWNNQGDAFHNMWQTYRTRKDRTLQTQIPHTYEEAGAYTVVVKVIDILGNDTTKTLEVEVR